MSQRKRLKRSDDSSMKMQRKNKENNSELYLSILPHEILSHICQYLSPLDLLSLSDVDPRFEKSTCYVKEGKFSSDCRANPQQASSFFSRLRVRHIRKLNFNHTIFIKPFMLVQLIRKCENLTALSIVGCGISMKYLDNILKRCTNLEELAWSVSNKDKLVQSTCCNKMKTVYLFFVHTILCKVANHEYIEFLLNFPNAEHIFLDFSPENLSVFPFHARMMIAGNHDLLPADMLIVITYQDGHLYTPFLKSLFNANYIFIMGDDGTPEECPKTLVPNNYVSYLEIQTEKDISLLLSKTYLSLSLFISPEVFYLSEDIMKNIEKAASNKLKHLFIGSQSLDMIDCDSVAVREIIRNIGLLCRNVTVLSLSFHFFKGSPFKAISQLQNLRILVIASCSFRSSNKKGDSCSFREMVKSCPKVQNFKLIGCTDYIEVSDSDMHHIHLWEELQHLTIYNVFFRSSNFLKHAANNCKKLKSFALITDQHFYPFYLNIIYLLKFAKNLTFIRLNGRLFKPMFERLWDSIGEAANLEGICIFTQYSGFISKQTIMKAIKKLKYLHLFHFYNQNISDNIFSAVRKSMQAHGVSNIKIEKNNGFFYLCSLNDQKMKNHQMPEFRCKHLHLEPLDTLPF